MAGTPEALPTSGAAHTSASAAAALVKGLDKFAAALPAQADRPLFGEALCDHDDLLLRSLDVGELHRTSCLHVVLENLRSAFGHVAQDLLLHIGLRTAQRDGEGVGADLAQQRLNTAIVDVEQVVEDEQQILDLLMHLTVGFLDLAELFAARAAIH